MTVPVVSGLSRLDVVSQLTGEYGQPLTILPWWEEAFSALDNPAILELIFWLMRQAGKSQLVSAMAESELLVRPGSYTILASASEKQAMAIFARKIRKPLERLLKALRADKNFIRFTQRGVEVPSTGSVLEVIAPNEDTVPGRSPTLLIFDEARDIPDSVYGALVPSVIGAGGKVVIASTAGRPRGFFYEMTKAPTEATWLYHSAENDNPQASRSVVGFLRERLGLISPASRLRELENQFAEDGDELLSAALIEAAVDPGLVEVRTSHLPAFAFLDLSRRRDLTSRVIVLRDASRHAEATDHLIAASVQVWDPRQSPTGEIDFAAVRADLASLPGRFPGLRKILVDEGAEAGSVLPWARSHPALSLRVEGFRATASNNMDLWGALVARLHPPFTLSIPRHDRLIAELRGLRREGFAFGTAWRVVDSSRTLHRDVSLALAGACYAAGAQAPCPFAPSPCPDPEVCPIHLWGGGGTGLAREELEAVDARARSSSEEIIQSVRATGVWFPNDGPPPDFERPPPERPVDMGWIREHLARRGQGHL